MRKQNSSFSPVSPMICARLLHPSKPMWKGLRDGIANTEEKKRRYYDAIKIRTEDLADLIDNLSPVFPV